MVLFAEHVFSTLFVSLFGQKSENFQSWKIRKYVEETEYFETNAFIFQKDIVTKMVRWEKCWW